MTFKNTLLYSVTAYPYIEHPWIVIIWTTIRFQYHSFIFIFADGEQPGPSGYDPKGKASGGKNQEKKLEQEGQ